MKYIDFLTQIEPLKKEARGHGKAIAKKAGVKKHQYYNALSGKIKNPTVLSKIFKTVNEFLEEKATAFLAAS